MQKCTVVQCQSHLKNLNFCVIQLPKKIISWKGKKQFTKEANVCVQMSYKTLEVIGSEDCLFLNVFTTISSDKINNENESNLMPVLFWIHGGSFNVGSASSDLNRPDFILEKVT